MKTAYINATIFNQKNNAFIVENDKFVAVGRKQTILNQNIDQIIDLHNYTVLPGFHDSHLHLLGLGWMMSMANLSSYESFDTLVEALKKRPENPLICRGFHESQFKETTPLNKDILNKIADDKPIVFYRVCGHMVVANDYAINAALELDPNPPNTEQVNLTTGIFKEDAIKWVMQGIPKPDAKRLQNEILTAQKKLLSYGITAVGSDDFAIYDLPFETVVQTFQKLDESNKLKLRVLEQSNLPKLEDLKRYIKNGYANKHFKRYRLGPLKLLADGSLGARSAFVSEPYEDKDTTGIRVFEPSHLDALIKTANTANMDVAIHGIGDQIIEEIIDIIESIPEAERMQRRHSIIHAQLARHDQIPRMQALNIGAQTQPIFINSDLSILPASLGERRFNAYLFKTMLELGVKVTLSTDAPVEDPNPFENMYTAITRKSLKNPELGTYLDHEKFTIVEAVRAYTETPAYYSYQENQLGKIKRNYQADFIIVKDFDETNPESLKHTKVLKTYIAGQCEYSQQ